MTEIVLIDLSSIVYPLFYLSGKEPDPNWTSTQAVAKVHALASSAKYAAVCVDGSRSFRKDLDPTYKANRPERDQTLIHQLKLAEAQLLSDGFPIWKETGYEADDVIASAVNALYDPQKPITIATADKDLLQLVCPGVSVLNGSGPMDAEAVKSKYGVQPEQMRDFLTLVGDASDNVKGAKGIGAKKAAELLERFGSIDEMYRQWKTIGVTSLGGFTPALTTNLREFQDVYPKTRELIELRTDAPIDFQTIYQPRVRTAAANVDDAMSDTLESPATIVDEEQKEQPPSSDVTKATEALTKATPVDVEPFVGAWERQLEPRNPADARTIAKWLHSSRLYAQYGSPEAVFSILLAGRELGLGTMASLRGFHVVEGKPTMASDLIRALVLASGKAEFFVCKERTAKTSTWETKRKGDPYPVSLTFTFEEAVLARVMRSGSAWEKHPADMLAKTASAKLSRLVYSDVTFGLYATEELGGDEAA